MAPAVFSSPAPSLDTVLAHMDQAANGFTGLTADVRKLAYIAAIQDENKDSGKLVLKRNKARDVRMLLDIKEPDPTTYTVDGREVHHYMPRAQTDEVYETGKYKSLINQFLLLGFGSTSKELQNAYTISLGGPEAVGSEKTIRLELIPKSPEVLKYFKRVDLWISDVTGFPLQQKFYSPSGDYNLATYSNMIVNPNLPDSAVKLNLPKGVKTIHPQR